MLLTTPRTSIRRTARRAGFTLLEVLVVVAILVILASVATIATQRYLEDARRSRAMLGAKGLQTAIEAYVANPANPGLTEELKLPSVPGDLLQPPFGGSSYLRNGQADLIDPWGNPYVFELRYHGDNTPYILVHTTTKDGTPISQFGIGALAMPQF